MGRPAGGERPGSRSPRGGGRPGRVRPGAGSAVGARGPVGAQPERLERRALLDRGRGRLRLHARSAKLLEQLLARESVLLGDLMYALLAHRLTDSTSLGSTVT